MDTLEEATTTTTTASKRSGAARRRLKKQREAAALEARLAQLTLAAETPPRLPPELVYRILQLGVKLFAARVSADGTTDHAERSAFLCMASLVCSLWREEAQKLLWINACIRSNEGMKSFILSAGKARTTSLAIQPRLCEDHETSPLDSQWVKEVILATTDLRTLVLGGFSGIPLVKLDPTIFASAKISGLQYLVLNSNVLYSRSSATPLRHLPFALEELGLDFVWSSRNTYFPWHLAAALLNSTSTSVKVLLSVDDRAAAVTWARNAAFKPGAVPNISALFEPNAVSTLELYCEILVDEPCWAGILGYIKQCKTLQTLETNSACADLLLALPHPLHTLTIVHATVEKYDAVLQGLRAGWRGLSQLQILKVEREVEATEQGESVEEVRRSWEELSEECRRRGITLRREALASS